MIRLSRSLRDSTFNLSDASNTVTTPRPDAAFLYYLLKKVEKLELTDPQGAYLSAQWRRGPAAA